MHTKPIRTPKLTERQSRSHPAEPLFAQATRNPTPSSAPITSVLIRVHLWPIPVLPRAHAILTLCAKKKAKISKRGGNEPEYLREIRHFLHSNLRIFAYFLQKPHAEPEHLRLALSKTRFNSPKTGHWPPTTDHFFNVSRHPQTPQLIGPPIFGFRFFGFRISPSPPKNIPKKSQTPH